MKRFLNNIKTNKLSVNIRNFLNLRPLHLTLPRSSDSISVSDNFCWRTDRGYETEIRFFDILKLFYQLENTTCHVVFYSSNGRKLKELEYKNLKKINILRINKELLDGTENYGTFCIFHNTKDNLKNIIIANKCYTGYSLNKNLFSFAHGNTYAKHKKFSENKEKSEIIHTSNSKHNYKIQNNFLDVDNTELFFQIPPCQK